MTLRSPLTVQPYDYISDSIGRPLDKGQIYIGVAGQDPEFYQIPVYLDAAMTKLIDQPIRTNDGFVDFAGSLSELYASAEVYSVKVLDKEGRKVLYKGDMTRKNLMSDALADLNQSIIDTQTAAQITLNAAVNSANTEVTQTVSLATAAIDTATAKSNKAATDADTAIKTLFENGGLPAEPFATKALMEASALIDGDYAIVTDDTVNNGLYVKTAGAWVKSKYDPVGQSNNYTDFKAFETNKSIESLRNESINASSDLEQAIDNNEMLYRRVDENGDMYVTNLAGSVQENLNRHDKLSAMPNGVPDIQQLWDANDNLVSRTDNRGAEYIAGGKGSVQHFMREPLSNAGAKYNFDEPIKLSQKTYSPEIKSLVHDLQTECLPYIEPPLLLVPNNINVPDSILDVISIGDDNPVAHLPFPYGVGGSVHPYALTVRKPLYGYRHLLLDSSHKNSTEAEETPCMFGTNDWVNFDLIPDVTQPFIKSEVGSGYTPYNSYHSDPFFSYDPLDGALIYGSREVLKYTTGATVYHVTKSYDGVRWTKREPFSLPSSVVSPAILYDPVAEIWHLWGMNQDGIISHYTAPTYKGEWTFVATTDIRTTLETNPWHMEVKYLGGKFVLCCASRQANSQVYLGFSTDGTNWIMSDGLVSPTPKSIYKPSFEVEFQDADTMRFIFFWSHWDWVNHGNHDPEMPLHVQYSNWITLSSLT